VLDFSHFSLLLPDVMTIADEVDLQLTQAMVGYGCRGDGSGSVDTATVAP